MKSIGKLKLNQLNNSELGRKEMKILKGGYNCACVCACMGGNETQEFGMSCDYTETNYFKNIWPC